jgi:hypothetical protein
MHEHLLFLVLQFKLHILAFATRQLTCNWVGTKARYSSLAESKEQRLQSSDVTREMSEALLEVSNIIIIELNNQSR